MKNTNIVTAIAKAVAHANLIHGVSYDKLYVQMTQLQISTMYAQYESGSMAGLPLPPEGAWGLEAPEGKVVITISTSIDKGNDKIDVTIGNDGCVDVPMTMAQLVLLLQDYGIALGEAGDKANVSLNVTRKGKQAEEAISEVKGKLLALARDMFANAGHELVDGARVRKWATDLQEIVS